jgi:hypothetical protein
VTARIPGLIFTKRHEAEDDGGFPVLGKHYPELRSVLDELSSDQQIAEGARSAESSVHDGCRRGGGLNELRVDGEEAKAVARAPRLSG